MKLPLIHPRHGTVGPEPVEGLPARGLRLAIGDLIAGLIFDTNSMYTHYPKQFLPLLGNNSLFQATLNRARHISNCQKPVLIADEESFQQAVSIATH